MRLSISSTLSTLSQSSHNTSFNDEELLKILEMLESSVHVPDKLEEMEETSQLQELSHRQYTSFFSLPLLQAYLTPETVPLRVELESLSHPSFRTYDHPKWHNWYNIWNAPPITINASSISKPTVETEFHSALFRLRISSKDLHKTPLKQGTTIEFKGFENQRIRFIVEWCQKTTAQYAYLKVTGISIFRTHSPYNDPDFPSFILVVPKSLAHVPFPHPLCEPPLTSFLQTPLTYLRARTFAL